MAVIYKHKEIIRVRYSETDQMGVVYYGNYASYLEIGRVEYMRSIGFVYKDFEDSGVIMPVVHYEIDYKYPAKYDDELTLETWVEELPTSKVTFNYTIYNKDKKCCDAKVILVFLDQKTFRPIKASAELIALLKDKVG